MIKLTTTKARERFGDTLNRVASGKERVVLTRRGKDLVAIIPLEDLARLQALEDKQDLRDARAALREIKKHGTIPLDQLRRDLGC
ncbi:MAG TPA: type II toxin-antitoxin system Phd/YefM family antitoxin [Thermoanaerobaculia bacterium]|jgi:prevent-host-death family protein